LESCHTSRSILGAVCPISAYAASITHVCIRGGRETESLGLCWSWSLCVQIIHAKARAMVAADAAQRRAAAAKKLAEEGRRVS
jgi:hypothetical protein